MPPFKLNISSHAKERLKKRSIPRRYIRSTLARPDERDHQYNDRVIARKKFNNKTLSVVYIATTHGYNVVTAYWEGIYP